MDAWNKANSFGNANAKKKSTNISYAKWDKIVDSDDEDDIKKAIKQSGVSRSSDTKRMTDGPGDLGDVPPHLKMAYAKVSMAQQTGDEKALAMAMKDLEAGLQAMPESFRRKLEPFRAAEEEALEEARQTKARQTKAAAAPALDDVQSQLAKLEKAQAGLQAMSADPSKIGENMPAWLRSVGISHEEIEAAESAANPQAAMTALAQKAMTNTLGGDLLASAGKMASLDTAAAPKLPKASANESAESKALREKLEAQNRKLAESKAAVERQVREAEEARARVAKATAALEEAETKKQEQGKVVDSTVEGAKADMMRQAEIQMEDTRQRAAVINDLRERGNAAMKNGDPTAAREFYSQALSVPSVPPDERAKLFGNRAACLLQLKRADLALIDAEEACDAMPGWGKAWYRLGCIMADVGDALGAISALDKAATLLGEGANGAVVERAKSVRASLDAAIEAAVAEAGGPVDGPKARAAARVCRAESASTAATAKAAAATRTVDRAQARLMEAASSPHGAQAAAAFQEIVDDEEEAATKAADTAAAAASTLKEAQTLRQEAEAFDAARAAAQALYASGQFAEACDAFASLIDAAVELAPPRPTAGSAAAKQAPAKLSTLATARQREAYAALPALYGNRAACALQMSNAHHSNLHDCVADCDAAITATAHAASLAEQADTAESDAPPPPLSPFKLKLRRIEARRRLLQHASVKGDGGDGLSTLREEIAALKRIAASDAERTAVEHLEAAVSA